jgi:hypothetical protein
VVYLRLAAQDRVSWANRGHFFGVASQMMRRIPVFTGVWRDLVRGPSRQSQDGAVMRASGRCTRCQF